MNVAVVFRTDIKLLESLAASKVDKSLSGAALARRVLSDSHGGLTSRRSRFTSYDFSVSCLVSAIFASHASVGIA